VQEEHYERQTWLVQDDMVNLRKAGVAVGICFLSTARDERNAASDVKDGRIEIH
jgi:hypothetical protein